MAHVPFPSVNLRGVSWRLRQPAQVNRSGWTGRRQVLGLPGGAVWEASGEFVTRIGQANFYELRAFLAALRGPVNTFALPAWEARQMAFYPSLRTRSSLTIGANVTVSSDQRTVTATTSGSWGTKGAYSTTSTTSGAVLTFRPGQAQGENIMAGINADASATNGSSDMDYAFLCSTTGEVAAYESGVSAAYFGRYKATDIFAIVYDNSTVKYYRNGELLRSVATTAGRTFFADFAFEGNIGATISDINFCANPLVSAGVRSVDVSGLTPSTTRHLRAGMMATALFKGGGAQLVVLNADVNSDASGLATLTFDQPLRGQPYALVTDYPFAEMALSGDTFEYKTDAGQIYSVGFSAEEAF